MPHAFMKNTTILCAAFFMLLAAEACAQTQDDSLSVFDGKMLLTQDTITSPDSVQKVKPARDKKQFLRNVIGFFNLKKNYPSPKKAIVLSAILPGAGQVYNKKYWKLPLVYGALGTMGYFIYFSDGQYKRFRKAYIFRLDEDPNTIDEFTTADGVQLLGDAAIKAQRDLFRKRRELSYIGMVFTYALVGVDAFVDAHLLRFDVSDELSLFLQPYYQLDPLTLGGGVAGIHLRLSGH